MFTRTPSRMCSLPIGPAPSIELSHNSRIRTSRKDIQTQPTFTSSHLCSNSSMSSGYVSHSGRAGS